MPIETRARPDGGRPGATDPVTNNLVAVLCGSYKRDSDGLRAAYEGLKAASCHVSSPKDLAFIEVWEGFAFAADEVGRPPQDIEAAHLAALQRADFMWFHAPGGYVGVSGALEVGFAHALGKPVFSNERPRDVTLAGLVAVVGSPAEAAEIIRRSQPEVPIRGLAALQTYYKQVAMARGYDSESPADSMLLLTEEVGELARAIRKHIGLKRDGAYPSEQSIAAELADVQLYILHLANVLGAELAAAVDAKERVNAEKALARERSA